MSPFADTSTSKLYRDFHFRFYHEWYKPVADGALPAVGLYEPGPSTLETLDHTERVQWDHPVYLINTEKPQADEALTFVKARLDRLEAIQQEVCERTKRERPPRGLLLPEWGPDVRAARVTTSHTRSSTTQSRGEVLDHLNDSLETLRAALAACSDDPRRQRLADKAERRLAQLDRVKETDTSLYRVVSIKTALDMRARLYPVDAAAESWRVYVRKIGLILHGPEPTVVETSGQPRAPRSDSLQAVDLDPVFETGGYRYYDEHAWKTARGQS